MTLQQQDEEVWTSTRGNLNTTFKSQSPVIRLGVHPLQNVFTISNQDDDHILLGHFHQLVSLKYKAEQSRPCPVHNTLTNTKDEFFEYLIKVHVVETLEDDQTCQEFSLSSKTKDLQILSSMGQTFEFGNWKLFKHTQP